MRALQALVYIIAAVFVGYCIRDWRDKARAAKRKKGAL